MSPLGTLFVSRISLIVIIYMKLSIVFLFSILSIQADEMQLIKDQFKKWQPILHDSSTKYIVYYHTIWGDRYEHEKWSTSIDDTTKFISQSITLYKDANLGYVIKRQETSPSGDWFTVSEHYFSKNGNLYFIFWLMNTFYSETPLTVERRLYFDSKISLIRKLESTFKMNTKEKIENASYMDKDVDYWENINQIKFLKIK